MPGFRSGFGAKLVALGCQLVLFSGALLAGQTEGALNEFFEGKQVIVKLDMPGSQLGVDVYPRKSQGLDLKSYSKRIKDFGPAVRSGDSVLISKIKVKDKAIEFQLGGGGFGTITDDTDSSVHYAASDKSGREKELEDQLKKETDPDRRRSLQRELDDVRNDRERRDRRDRAAAEDAAESKKQTIYGKRQHGGSRFNIKYDSRLTSDELKPESVMGVLSQWVTFSRETFGPLAPLSNSSAPAASYPAPASPPGGAPANADVGLRKGLTFEQVVAMFGQPKQNSAKTQNGLKIISYTFEGKNEVVQGDFVNGVLVQYTVSSR